MAQAKRHVVVTGEGAGYRFTVHGDPDSDETVTAGLAFETIAHAPVRLQGWDEAALTFDRLVSGGVDVLVHTSAAGLLS